MTDKYYYEHQAPEHEWLEWYNQHESKNYVGTSTTIDLIVVKLIDNKLSVLMKARDIHPFKDQLALPGSYIHSDELESSDTIHRIYSDKLGLDYSHNLKQNQIQQLATYADANRDPRGRVVSISYIIYDDKAEAKLGYQWIELSQVMHYSNLAFNHGDILFDAFKRISDQFSWTPFSLYALPQPFTLRDLVALKADLHQKNAKLINRANLRKKMLKFIKKDHSKNNITYYKPTVF